MRRRGLAAAALIVLGGAFAQGAAGAAPSTPPGSPAPERSFDPASFAAPAAPDRPNAFWFWNGRLTEDELERQLHLMQANGVEEFFIHPRQGPSGVFGGTENAYYLSKDYFDKVGFVLAKTRELGMHAWLYDDLNWPSGYAGGRVLEGGDVDSREVAVDPELIARFLQVRPRDVRGGAAYEEPAPSVGGEGWSIQDGALATEGGDVGRASRCRSTRARSCASRPPRRAA
jgi:hypothetical protein